MKEEEEKGYLGTAEKALATQPGTPLGCHHPPQASHLEMSPFMQTNHPHPRVSSTLYPRWSLNILVCDTSFIWVPLGFWLVRFNMGPFVAQPNPTHPPGHNHGDRFNQALECHQLVETEHLTGGHIQPMLGHDAYGEMHDIVGISLSLLTA